MIYCQIATFRFVISAEEPLTLLSESHGLQGFSFPQFPSEEADFCVTLHQAQNFNASQYKILNTFSAQSPDITHNFRISTTEQGTEIITVNFNSHPSLHKVILTICNNKIDIYISLIDEKQTAVNAYIFPLLNITISRIMLRQNGLLVHSSVVDDHGSGYLFTAVSGTGKSTIARLFQHKGATIINDDINAIKLLKTNNLQAHNIPMPYYFDKPKTTNLKAIFLIEQSPENFIELLPGAVGALRFSANSINYPLDKSSASMHFETVKKVADIVPIYRLGFKPDEEIVLSIRNLNL